MRVCTLSVRSFADVSVWQGAGGPLYSVRWLPSAVATHAAGIAGAVVLPLGTADVALGAEHLVALAQGRLVIDLFVAQAEWTMQREVRQCWQLARLAQQLLADALPENARLVLLSPAARHGSMSVGLSKAVAMEEPDLKIVRVFVNPGEYDPARSAQLAVDAASRYPSESDVWLQGGRMLVPRLVPEVVPSRSVALHIAPDETILITGTQRHAAQRTQRSVCSARTQRTRSRAHAYTHGAHARTHSGGRGHN